MPAGVRVRAYREADYEQVAALWCAVGFHPRAEDSRAALAFKVKRDRGLVLVAESGGRIVGTAMGSWDGRRAWVNRVAVHPAHRRQGIGRELMAQVESRLAARGADHAALDTDAESAARTFYEHLGYEVREGLVVMSKGLVKTEEPDDGSSVA